MALTWKGGCGGGGGGDYTAGDGIIITGRVISDSRKKNGYKKQNISHCIFQASVV